MELVQGLEEARRAKSVICGHGEQHRNNILYKLKYGRGANCERSHYMKTAGRKCFATAENLQDRSDHQTVTLHLAWRLRSVDGYLPHREGRIRCHAFVGHIFLPPFSSSFYLSGQTEQTELPFSSSSLSSSFSSAAALPHCVFSPFQALSFLPLSPSFSLCLWSVTLNLAPSICFSSSIGPALFLIKTTSGFDLL